MIKLLAPAKINLTLEVLAKRSDGFHEILSVIQAIGFGDSFSFQPGKEIVIKCDNKTWSAQQSLATRAAALLKQETGYSEGAVIEVSKKIPLSSGLGGDSSDAATVLSGLNRLWDLNISKGGLAKMGSQLGSDVPFFLFGGTALLRGRGEMVSPLPSLKKMWLVLLMPPVKRLNNKTALLYKNLSTGHNTDGRMTEELVALLTREGQITPDNLYNVFENVAYESFKGLDEYRQRFTQAGAESVHLAGSGPALFTMAKEKARAKKIYTELKGQELEAYLAETLEAI
ncbi:4-(cytidine 5'-diphospho)-2-C-methyl-D-erythritol kinase [Chloroflexota bacterium]